MAKHDQRILKFLAQNGDRAPTITDMMTRLNISVNDITASLNSLLAQGIISKRTNGQGIECWFPVNGGITAQSVGLNSLAANSGMGGEVRYAQNDMAAVGETAPMQNGVSQSIFSGGLSERPPTGPGSTPPQPTYPANTSPYNPTTESATTTGSLKALFAPVQVASNATGMPNTLNTTPSYISPGIPPSSFTPISAASLGLNLGNSSPKPVTFLHLGLAAGVSMVLAIIISGFFAGGKITKASKKFAEQNALSEAISSWAEFETQSKAKVKALEGEVKRLSTELEALNAQNESLKAEAAAAAARKPVRRRR